MKGPIFKDSNEQQFYYSPSTGRIIPIPKGINLENLIEEKTCFKFKFNPQEVRRKLDEERESIILETTEQCNLSVHTVSIVGIISGKGHTQKKI